MVRFQVSIIKCSLRLHSIHFYFWLPGRPKRSESKHMEVALRILRAGAANIRSREYQEHARVAKLLRLECTVHAKQTTVEYAARGFRTIDDASIVWRIHLSSASLQSPSTVRKSHLRFFPVHVNVKVAFSPGMGIWIIQCRNRGEVFPSGSFICMMIEDNWCFRIRWDRLWF